MKEGGYPKGELVTVAATSEGANSALCRFTDLNRTPLMQLNPNLKENRNDPRRLLEIMLRFSRPWEELVSLTDDRQNIAYELEVSDTDPLIEMILVNPCEAIKASDLFEGGRDTVDLVKVFTVKNGKEIAEEVKNRGDVDHPLSELLDWGDEKWLFVSGGYFFKSPDYPTKNLLLSDGSSLTLIPHKEHDVYVPREDWMVKDYHIVVGGYNVKERVKAEVELLNRKKDGVWKGHLTADKVVGKPYYIIQNTYMFFDEVLNDTLEMLGNIITGGVDD